MVTPNGGLRSFYSLPKDFECGCHLRGWRFLKLSNDKGLQRVSFKVQAVRDPVECIKKTVEQSVRSSLLGTHDGSYSMGTLHLQFIENSEMSAPDSVLPDSAKQSVYTGLAFLEAIEVLKGPVTLPESLSLDNDMLSRLKSSIEGSSFGVNGSFSIDEAVEKVENTLRSTYDLASSSIESIIKRATGAIDSSVNQIGASASNRYSNISGDLKEAANQVASASIGALRTTVLILEDFLKKGASFIVSSYNSNKDLRPPQFRESLKVFEEKAAVFGKPVGVAGQQVYLASEQLERTLGLDLSESLVPFLLFLGVTSAFWAWTYGGYSGYLSPKLTSEILMRKEGAAAY